MQSSTAAGEIHPRAYRRERLALLIGFGLGSLAWNFCWPFLPLRVEAVGVSDLGEIARLAGLLAGATNLITAALGPIWILVGERFGYKYQVMRAHCGTAISMATIGLARGPAELAGAATLLGTFGGNYPHYLALAASRTPAAEVGQVVGDLQAAGQIGSTIGPIVGGVIASRLGLSASFLLSSVVSFGAFMVAAVAIRPDRPKPGERSATRGSLRAALSRPDHRWLMVVFLVGDAGIQGLRPLIPVVISQRIADPATVITTTGLTATLAMVGTVVSALAVGRLSSRVAPATILRVSLPAAALCAAAIPLAQGTAPFLAAWTLLGFAAGATTPAVFAWLGRISPGSSGAFALLATVNMLDFAIGPAIMGQLSIYGLDWPFRVAAASTAGAAIFVLVSRPSKQLVSK